MKLYYIFKYSTCLFLLLSGIGLLGSCDSDSPEMAQEVADESRNMPTITVYSDGTTSTGDIYERINSKEFYIADLRYSFSEKTQEAMVVGCRDKSTIETVAPYAKIIIEDVTYITRRIGKEAFCMMLRTGDVIQNDLKTIELPYSVEVIEAGAFSCCGKLTNVTLPNSLKEIGSSAFHTSSLYHIELPQSLKSLGGGAFSNTLLTSITLNDGLETIGSDCFSDCYYLRHVSIPSSVTSIPNTAFRNCRALIDIDLPSTIVEIGEYAFDGCGALREFAIPKSTVKIGNGALHCAHLTTVKSYALIPPEIGRYIWGAFYRGMVDVELWVPESALQNYQKEPWLSIFKEIHTFNDND